MKTSDSIKSIAKAMHEFRVKVKQPKKEAKNPFFKKNYVDLEGVQKAIDEALPEGLSWGQEATSGDHSVSVSTFIIHSSGEYMIFEPLTIPADKRDAQRFGSAETYARRYSLSAAFGISSNVDDDGEQASNHQNQQNRRQSDPRDQQNGRGSGQNQPGVKPITNAQMTQLMGLFKSMANLGDKPLAEVQKFYLIKSHVTGIEKLSYDQGRELIDVVSRQLSDKADDPKKSQGDDKK
ncbi:MAG TPA: ERF family protein [Candidatus Levilactobacillus faecigallinarum]|uniref:ERF family protein n=1 Tax=Candidatus Levilactobacillus faecigallinarum TaxID=2838638 RepID=A0A9D1QTJ0_9LACO|nr:ERF family protein [Candidatus Levilactobacillus faecigallinarum]